MRKEPSLFFVYFRIIRTTGFLHYQPCPIYFFKLLQQHRHFAGTLLVGRLCKFCCKKSIMEVKTFPAGLSETFTEMLIVIALVISVSALVQYHWRRRRLYRMAAKIPGPPTYPIIGNAHLFIGSPKSKLSYLQVRV